MARFWLPAETGIGDRLPKKVRYVKWQLYRENVKALPFNRPDG